VEVAVIVERAPAGEKNVSQLMYVGDDLQSRSQINWTFLVAIGAALYVASFLFKKR
jgi:hypothetical protein